MIQVELILILIKPKYRFFIDIDLIITCIVLLIIQKESFMEVAILIDIIIILGLALIVTYICNLAKIPVIVGFLLTGTIAGPFGFSFISAVHEVEVIAEIGVILLLFSIGMEFSIKHLLQIRKAVLLGGSVQVVLTFAFVTGIAFLFELSTPKAIFAGFLGALSSTAIVLKHLQTGGQIEAPQGRTTLGILIFQDVIIVPMMIVTPFLASTGDFQLNTLWLLAGKMILLLILIYVGTKWIIPKLFFMIAGTKNRELFLLSVVFIAFAIAWITSQIGLSLALGAFIAGLMIAESQYSHNAISHILPFRDIFMSFFFVSVGMLLNLNTVFEFYPYILGFFVLLIIIKIFTASFATLLLKYPLAIALMVGFSLAQIGEFSFILAKTGKAYDLIDQTAYQLFLAVAVLTMLVTPFLINLGEHADKISRWVPLPKRLKQRRFDTKNKPPRLSSHLIIVGYGLNGKNLVHAAQVANLPYLIVDLNPDTVNRERKAGLPIFFGDASQTAVLEEMQVMTARVIIIAGPDVATMRRIVFLAKLQNPEIHIIARTRFVSEIEPLRELGADEVIAEEFESAIEIFTRVLKLFNISNSQINALTQEVRAEDYSELRTNVWASDKLDDLNLPDVDIQRVKIPQDSALIDKSIKHLISTSDSKINVLVLKRENQFITNPSNKAILKSGDILVLFGKPIDLNILIENNFLEVINEI